MNDFQYNVNALQQQFAKINKNVKKLIFHMRLSIQQQQKKLFNLFNSFSSRTSKMLIIQLNNNVAKRFREFERFKKFNIKYFDFTCSKSYNKSDYVIINDKIYYRNV